MEGQCGELCPEVCERLDPIHVAGKTQTDMGEDGVSIIIRCFSEFDTTVTLDWALL